jgi:hypothetical protein
MGSWSRLVIRTITVLTSIIVLAETTYSHGAVGESGEVDPLPEQWNLLAMITVVHSVPNKKLGLEIRVLEADGSASVAEDPVSVFIVARRGATSELTQYIWRLPHGVERVKKVTASKCGLLIEADVGDGAEPVQGRKLVAIKACFIQPNGRLNSRLRLEDSR